MYDRFEYQNEFGTVSRLRKGQVFGSARGARTAPLPPLRAGVGPLRFSRARLGAERTPSHRLFGRFGWGRCSGVRPSSPGGWSRPDPGRPFRRRRQERRVGDYSQHPAQRPEQAAHLRRRPDQRMHLGKLQQILQLAAIGRFPPQHPPSQLMWRGRYSRGRGGFAASGGACAGSGWSGSGRDAGAGRCRAGRGGLRVPAVNFSTRAENRNAIRCSRVWASSSTGRSAGFCVRRSPAHPCRCQTIRANRPARVFG